MYNYSDISTILIKNFRNIGEVIIDFTESPIVSLIGENESGKTSIVKAVAVCAKHVNPREQKDYIRDGTNGFGIAIKLKDGSLITRMKTATVNKYEVRFSNGEVWDTAKIDAGLPVQVQELMGLVEEPETKELLQIRTYEDQLLFVTTSASANYKVMYDALKVDQLTRAIKVGASEVNHLKSKITSNEMGIKTLTNNLRSIKIYDLEPLINIRNRLMSQMSLLDKLERAKEVADRIREATIKLGALDLIDKHKLSEVNLVEVDRLVSASRLLSNNDRLIKLWEINNKVDTLEEVEVNTLSKISSVIAKRDELRSKIKSAGALVRLSELEEVDEYVAQQLNRIKSLTDKLNKDTKTYNIIEAPGCNLVEQSDFNAVLKIDTIKKKMERNSLLEVEAVKSENYVSQVEAYLKQCGAKVVNCTKCGESIVLDTESLDVHHH